MSCSKYHIWLQNQHGENRLQVCVYKPAGNGRMATSIFYIQSMETVNKLFFCLFIPPWWSQTIKIQIQCLGITGLLQSHTVIGPFCEKSQHQVMKIWCRFSTWGPGIWAEGCINMKLSRATDLWHHHSESNQFSVNGLEADTPTVVHVWKPG